MFIVLLTFGLAGCNKEPVQAEVPNMPESEGITDCLKTVPRTVFLTAKALTGSSQIVFASRKLFWVVVKAFCIRDLTRIAERNPHGLKNIRSSTPLFAKNHSPNGFLNAKSPLRVQVPFDYLQTKKTPKGVFFVWCTRRDLNPHVEDTRS